MLAPRGDGGVASFIPEGTSSSAYKGHNPTWEKLLFYLFINHPQKRWVPHTVARRALRGRRLFDGGSDEENFIVGGLLLFVVVLGTVKTFDIIFYYRYYLLGSSDYLYLLRVRFVMPNFQPREGIFGVELFLPGTVEHLAVTSSAFFTRKGSGNRLNVAGDFSITVVSSIHFFWLVISPNIKVS